MLNFAVSAVSDIFLDWMAYILPRLLFEDRPENRGTRRGLVAADTRWRPGKIWFVWQDAETIQPTISDHREKFDSTFKTVYKFTQK